MRGLLLVSVLLATPQPALANPIVPVTLGFEREGLDLDTGTIVPIEPWTLAADPADPQPDLVLACNSERTVRTVVFHNQMNGVQIAFLEGVAFNLCESAKTDGAKSIRIKALRWAGHQHSNRRPPALNASARIRIRLS